MKKVGGDASSFNEEFDSLMDTAMGGFMLVCGLDGEVIFASEGITTQLGVCQVGYLNHINSLSKVQTNFTFFAV
jgi:hypothetical protein